MLKTNRTGWFRKGLLLAALLFITVGCSEKVSENELMERAAGYIEARDLNAATLELKNVLISNANNARARYLLGEIYLSLGDIKAAKKELERALDAGWDEAATNILLAEVLFRQKQYQALLDDIPIKDTYPKPLQAELLGLWASAEAGLGHWDESAQLVKTGEAISKEALWLQQSGIRLLLKNGDVQAAELKLADALKVHPNKQDLWLTKAGLDNGKGDFAAADAALQKVVELDPLNTISAWGRQARLTRAQIWLKQQDNAKAQNYVGQVLKAYPGDPLANYLGGLIAFQKGDYDLTEERLLSALKVSPEHTPSLQLFGALNYVRKDFQQAAYYLEKAAASRPENVGAQALLGKTYLMLGQYDEAENRLTFASSKTDDNAELIALIGLSRLKSGDTDAGIEGLEKAAAAAPSDTAIRGELARAYMATGETERAISELESALEGKEKQYQTEALLLLAYLEAGEFDKSLNLANKLSEQLPDNPLPYNLAGVAYEGNRNLSAAREKYEAALGLKPDNVMAILGLARLDVQAGKLEVARERYNSVLELEPGNASAMVELARLATHEGKIEEALELLETAVKADEKAVKPRLILANYYLTKGMTEKSLEYANKALEIAPQNPLAMFAVGKAQLSAGKSVSIQTLQKLVARLSESADVYYYLAQAKARFKETGVRQSLKKAIELKPDHELAMRALGKLELSEGKLDDALKISQRMKEVLPEAASGYMLEGDVLFARGEKQQALKAYQSALAYAKTGEAAIKLSQAQRALGDITASINALREWLEQYPDDQTTRFVLAMSYLNDGNNMAAMTQYEQILEKQPENASALNDLAWLYFEAGKPQALELAEKAYRIAPDNPAIQDTYGWILVQKGRIESGLIALEQASTNAPGSPDIRYHLAAALVKAGDKGRAKQELSIILQSDKPFHERAAAEALQKELE